MDDKLLEQVGHFIGQTRAEVLSLTDERIAEAADHLKTLITGNSQVLDSSIDASAKSLVACLDAGLEKQEAYTLEQIEATKTELVDRLSNQLNAGLDLLREDTEEKRKIALAKVEELEKSLLDGVNETLEHQAVQHVEQIGVLTEQIKAQEIFEAQLTQRIAEIKDGEQGVQGNDGEDGLDRPILEPVELIAQKDYPKSTVGTHNGGLWIATKQSVGSPEDDPQAWHCMLDAMSTMSIDLLEDRRFKLSVRMSSGELIDDTFDIPYPDHKGIWEEGSYLKGDIVTKGSSMWLAQNDTDGQPPGNGWQQILSAPRGKQGPAGKSIEGPQGKPGRNGMDAILPANFIDDVIALASERKAFEDGRSGSEAITSFRGYFVPDETYRSGDVVNFDGGLFLCISGGQFRSIAQGQDSWELMLGVPKFTTPAYMLWQGAWEQKTYNGGMTVRDGDWTMVALTQTTDRAGPVAIGQERYPYTGTMTPFQNSAKSILYGQRYFNSGSAAFVNGYKIDVILDNHYEVYTVTDIDTAPVFDKINDIVASATEQRQFSIPQRAIRQGTVFDLLVQVNEPDPTPTQWTGDWNYDTPNNTAVPALGVVSQSNSNPESLRINAIDNVSGNRYAELDALTAGDKITLGTFVWTISNIVDNTTWFDFTVVPSQQTTPDGVATFTFDTVTATPITIGRDVDYWIANPNVAGLLAIDGGYSDLVPDDNAYGIIDVLVQDASVSDDWDVVAPGSGGAGTTQVQLSATETRWVQSTSTPLFKNTQMTTDNNWAEVVRYTIPDGTGIKILTSSGGKRVDDVGYFSSELSGLAYRNVTSNVIYTEDFKHSTTPNTDTRLIIDGADVVFEVRGASNEDWNWTTVVYAKEIEG